MWIINDDGFFSVVQDWDNADWLFIRSRSDTDLGAFTQTVQNLAGNSDWTPELLHTPMRDYQWRIRAPRHVWAQYLVAKAGAIDYGNFKSHCADTWHSEDRDWARERLGVLNDAWLLFNHWPNGELSFGEFTDE